MGPRARAARDRRRRLTSSSRTAAAARSAQVDRWVDAARGRRRLVGEATVRAARRPAAGLAPAARRRRRRGRPTRPRPLLVVPRRASRCRPRCEHGRVWGVMAQLYQVRSAALVGHRRPRRPRRRWRAGPAASRAPTSCWSTRCTPPSRSPPMEPSPYLPTTRRFVEPALPARRGRTASTPRLEPRPRRGSTRSAPPPGRSTTPTRIDRDAAWAAKRAALRLRLRRRPVRAARAAFERLLRPRGRRACDRSRPGARSPRSTACRGRLARRTCRTPPSRPRWRTFRRARTPTGVDFHRWLQWLLDAASSPRRSATARGRRDVARRRARPRGRGAPARRGRLGAAATRSPAASPSARRRTSSTSSARTGRQPPWRPDRLAELGYAPFRDMVRTVLATPAGMRVDHVIGLFRLWWIPDGMGAGRGHLRPLRPRGADRHPGARGAARRAPSSSARTSASSSRPRATTCASAACSAPRSCGSSGTTTGRCWRPEHYRELCLSTVTTHDLPPTAGYLALEHVAIRERLGLLTRPVEEERAAEEAPIAKVRDALRRARAAGRGAGVDGPVVALHRYLRADAVADARASRWPTSSATAGRSTSPAPTTSTPTGGSRSPAPDGRPLPLERPATRRWPAPSRP